MKLFLKFLGVMVVVTAVACGGGDGDTDTGMPDSGMADVCTPDCTDLVCGDDGCGGTCGTCEVGKKCADDQMTCEDCTADCTDLVCGDDGCGGTCDPGCGADEMCAADQKSCECAPDCTDKECGDDGCGGDTCGTCTGDKACIDFKCVDCTPDCTDKECGDDGCGDSCGDCMAFGKLATCGADQKCECTPDCTDKVCGDDGCAGETCGTCGMDEECYMGECVGPCTLPDAWDPTGMMTSLQSPADAEVVGNICPDFSGDGKGDNGLKALASMINPELEKALAGGEMGILFEFLGVATPDDFTLVGQVGAPESDGATAFLIEAAGYDPLCEPLITFPNSSITDGELAAGPSVFTLDLAALGVDEVPLVLSIGDTQITGTVTESGADGVVVTGGVLAGVLTKELVDEALATAEEACNVPEPESFCSYLSVAKQFLPMLFDLDLDEDGIEDAASVCFVYTLDKATISGFVPEQ